METKKEKLVHKFYKVLESFIGNRITHESRSIIAIFRRTLRIILGSISKFLEDEGLLRAASISYSLVVSFVPMLVVGFFISARIIEKDKYFLYAREFIRKQGIPIDPEPYFKIINELLNNANTITGIGFVILLFSATSVLRNIEDAMNTIWRVKKGRPWLQKISGFVLVLIFGPVFLTLGMSMGQSIVDRTAASGLLSFELKKNQIISVGEKSTYLRQESGEWKSENILSKIDFKAALETIVFNASKNQLISRDERENLLSKIYYPTQRDLYWKSFKSYATSGNRSLIITNNGCIVTSIQNGEFWNIQCFQREDVKLLFTVSFNNIKMFDNNTGFILGNDGLILATVNGGQTWNPAFHENIKTDLFDIIEKDDNTLLLVGSEFSAFLSNDGGKHWNKDKSFTSSLDNSQVNFTRIRNFFKTLWVTGDYGLLLRSSNSGKSWQKVNLGITRNKITDILFITPNKGYLLGEQGLIMYTNNGGTTWTNLDSGTNENLNNAIYSSKEKATYICGDGSIIMKNTADNPHIFTVVQKSPFGRAMFYAIGLLFVPFIIIAFIFFLIYKIMPYTEVNNGAAFYGAGVTSLLYVLFLYGFKYYVSSFSDGTFAIYGTLAAIPLSLLLVYVSAGIMIYGAEIAFFIQNPGLLTISGLTLKINHEKRQMWYGLKILYELYSNFEKGKGSTKKADLIRICQNDYSEFYRIMERYMDRNIIESTSKNRYTPVVGPGSVKISEIMEDIDPADYHVPDKDIDNEFRKRVAEYFAKLQKSRHKVSKNLTFADLFSIQKTKS